MMEKPSHLKFVLRTFSDDEIAELLDLGGNFRELRIQWRDAILSQMRGGKWDCGNGECLAMGEDGSLLNGQHRLSAARLYQRETGKKIWFWVATGVRSGSDRSMDQGLNRTLASLLRKDGVNNAQTCAAIAASDWRFVASKTGSLSTLFTGGGLKETSRISLPNAYEAWKRSSSKIQEWADIEGKLERHGLPRSTLLACCGFQFSKHHDMDAKLFFSLLCDGVGLQHGDPILILRERLLEDRRTPQAKMTATSMSAILVKAWVAWKTGTVVKALRFKQVGPHREEFPSHLIPSGF